MRYPTGESQGNRVCHYGLSEIFFRPLLRGVQGCVVYLINNNPLTFFVKGD